MKNQLNLFALERIRYFYVDVTDEKGNQWAHRVADPEETIRFIERELPGVRAQFRAAERRQRQPSSQPGKRPSVPGPTGKCGG